MSFEKQEDIVKLVRGNCVGYLECMP